MSTHLGRLSERGERFLVLASLLEVQFVAHMTFYHPLHNKKCLEQERLTGEKCFWKPKFIFREKIPRRLREGETAGCAQYLHVDTVFSTRASRLRVANEAATATRCAVAVSAMWHFLIAGALLVGVGADKTVDVRLRAQWNHTSFLAEAG